MNTDHSNKRSKNYFQFLVCSLGLRRTRVNCYQIYSSKGFLILMHRRQYRYWRLCFMKAQHEKNKEWLCLWVSIKFYSFEWHSFDILTIKRNFVTLILLHLCAWWIELVCCYFCVIDNIIRLHVEWTTRKYKNEMFSSMISL